MREVAQWFAEAVSVVEGCGEPEAELLLQRGITSLEDLATCQTEFLASLPGIDEAGAGRIKERAAELAEQKAEEEARAAEEAARAEAQALAEAEAAAQGQVAPGGPEAPEGAPGTEAPEGAPGAEAPAASAASPEESEAGRG